MPGDDFVTTDHWSSRFAVADEGRVRHSRVRRIELKANSASPSAFDRRCEATVNFKLTIRDQLGLRARVSVSRLRQTSSGLGLSTKGASQQHVDGIQA